MLIKENNKLKLKMILHKAEEGGFWAEVSAISGFAIQGGSFEELLENLYEAIEGCLYTDTGGSVDALTP